LQDFKFRPGKHGKPLLVTEGLPRRVRDYDFNLTNTKGLIGLAVAAGARVGIDCERLDRSFTFAVEKIAKRMYSPEERDELEGVCAPQHC
jgi:phosphopantetheinyl transferase